MSHDKLAYMANQIGRFFQSQKPETAVAGIEDHILKFWDPRMRKALLAQLAEGQYRTRSAGAAGGREDGPAARRWPEAVVAEVRRPWCGPPSPARSPEGMRGHRQTETEFPEDCCVAALLAMR